ncbi:MAG: sigma-54 dependent transcriptional regulator [Candidatus Thiodiazotropha sp. (ex Epidulcina cf. delphinae)]|nr:sigma-54 dependent transcriptional regulator [Candidatus Thiodiazotropha sp. (ex Epidulcina cf. delphinae)]
MRDKPSVLLVEDAAPMAALFQQYLKDEPIELSHVDRGKAAKTFIAQRPPDLLLLDLKLPDISGQEILQWIRRQGIPMSVVVITSHSSVDVAVEVMRIGAEDFLEKPVTADRLKTTVRNLLDKTRLQHLVNDIQSTFERKRYHGFIGSSLPMQAVYRIIDAAAPSKASVFITGESGTGKEVCAEAIHKQGPRAGRPFIALNCGAVPRDLMESEIFGHIKGAFTGASAERKGAASLADSGTLFLDEIGEMDMELQTKLLRFIQTGSFQKVGSGKVEQVDVRFICATNRDPLEAVAEKRLREDLYYRLHVVPLHLPPLRDRSEDIIAIASYFLVTYAKEEGKHFAGLAPEVEVILCHYGWPGNVRQLQNVIRNIVVLHEGKSVKAHHLPPPLNTALNEQEIKQLAQPHPQSAGGAHPENTAIKPLAQVERETIEWAIESCNGNIPRAAALLEVSPSTIYRKKQAWESDY